MSTPAFFFAITLASIASLSDSFLRCISCPCGSGNQNYTQCINESILKDFSCERWSHCQTCKANTSSCITCRPNHFGPTCSEISGGHTRWKRQDVWDVLHHPRYPRQSGSGRHSQIRCLNHGNIYHGRVIVILPFDHSSNPSADDDDFDFPHRTRLKYICDEGFFLVGKDTSRCGSKGFWTESTPKCVGETTTTDGTCKHPGVDVNGRVNNPLENPRRRRQEFPVGTELTFACNDGFEPEGATILACLSNGRWTSRPPICHRVLTDEDSATPSSQTRCLNLNHIPNGRVHVELPFDGTSQPAADDDDYDFPLGTRLRFTCEEGFTLAGTDSVICESYGFWSADKPQCTLARF